VSVLLDAGPALNFLAVGQQGVLLETAKAHALQLTAPERVETEVLGKSKDALFKRAPVQATWLKLKANGHIMILDDALTTAVFTDAVTRISGMPATKRIENGSSLGEILVMAHASALAQAGTDVFILMDEDDGRKRCIREQKWLTRHGAPGRLTLWATRQVLKQADPAWFGGGRTWQQVYNQMRPFDLALTAL
jgi:hypothetical protein